MGDGSYRRNLFFHGLLGTASSGLFGLLSRVIASIITLMCDINFVSCRKWTCTKAPMCGDDKEKEKNAQGAEDK